MDERQGPRLACEAPAEGGCPRRAVDDLLDYQSACWQRGERTAVDACVDLRPELHQDEDAVLDLIYNEILLRARWGESPILEEYVRRFPRFAMQIEAQFEVHQALGAGDSSSAPSTTTGDPGAAPRRALDPPRFPVTRS